MCGRWGEVSLPASWDVLVLLWSLPAACCLLFLLITASSLESKMTITLKWLGACDVTRICERHFSFSFCCKWKTKGKTKKCKYIHCTEPLHQTHLYNWGKNILPQDLNNLEGRGYSPMDLHSFYPQVPSNWTSAFSESWEFSKSDATRPYEPFSGHMQFWHQRLESFVAVIGGGEKSGSVALVTSRNSVINHRLFKDGAKNINKTKEKRGGKRQTDHCYRQFHKTLKLR